MKTNKWFWILFSIIALCALWMTEGTLKKIYTYYSLNSHLPAKSITWKIHPINDERYQLQGNYRFFLGEKEYLGTSTLYSHVYRNPWGAEKGLKDIEKEPLTIWYSSSDPTINSLERNFPLKESLYSIIILALIAYFIGFGVYTYRSQNLER